VDGWVASQREGLSLEPLWPNGRPFAVCLTHDVDLIAAASTPRQAGRYARAGLEHDGAALPVRAARAAGRLARSLRAGVARAPSAQRTLERSVAIEAERGVTASYLFTVPPRGRGTRYDCVYAPEDECRFRGRRLRVADVMRTLADEGFDVGLHGSYRGAADDGVLAADRSRLESATGLEVTTTRQHLLHWDVRSTPRLQEAAGLRVDSSLGFNRNVGFRAATSLPFRWYDLVADAPLNLLEVPLVLHDVGLLDVWGLELDLERAAEVVQRFLDRAARAGTAITFVFHPDKLDRDDWRALYEATLDEALARRAWVTSLAGLGDWWEAREARVLGSTG
jgi:hypothetical protein